MSGSVDPTSGVSLGGYSGGIDSEPALAAFVSSIVDGGDLQTLLTKDASSMRRLKLELSSFRTKIQWQLVKDAADKMREASKQGLYSAILGSAAQVAASIYTAYLHPSSDDYVGKLKTGLANAVAQGISSCNVFTMRRDEMNARSQELSQAAGIQGQLASETSSLMDAARKLEQAMLRHFEKMADAKERTSRGVIDRIG
ncbi:MAG: hypothetical protein D6806_15525 [Deltaproteobacteria bacterium]|nr:MAG: hypothetical protein D6806_15525 [Deltaproteobacteria bacterium]